jgi:hypothetical protein
MKSFAAGLLLALSLSTVGASAAPITFSFTGTVTDDPFGLSSFGAPIFGDYTFDSASVDAIPGPAAGSYTSIGPAFGFNANVDGMPFSVSGSLNVSVLDAFIDQYLVTASDGTLTLEIFLEDSTGTAFSSDALPLTPPLLSSFDTRQFRFFAPDAEFLGTVDTLVCTAGCDGGANGRVPEPGMLWLLGAALAALGFCRRSTVAISALQR